MRDLRRGNRGPDEDTPQRVPYEGNAGRDRGVVTDLLKNLVHEAISHGLEAREGVALLEE